MSGEVGRHGVRPIIRSGHTETADERTPQQFSTCTSWYALDGRSGELLMELDM